MVLTLSGYCNEAKVARSSLARRACPITCPGRGAAALCMSHATHSLLICALHPLITDMCMAMCVWLLKSLVVHQLKNSTVYNAMCAIITESWLLQLVYLGLTSNSLNGSLPSSWGLLSKLKYAELQINSFTGSMPASWMNWNEVGLLALVL